MMTRNPRDPMDKIPETIGIVLCLGILLVLSILCLAIFVHLGPGDQGSDQAPRDGQA